MEVVKREMSGKIGQIYEFGPFRLDTSRRLLFRDGDLVTLTPKLFETLRALIERAGEPLSKDALMQEVWGETIVEETNLTTNVSNLRKLLGETKNEHQYILTIPGEGYQFVAPVRLVQSDSVEVVVHESVRTKLTVAETSQEQSGFNRTYLLIIAGLAGLLIIVSGYFFWSRRASTVTGGPRSIKSVAVLPFKPLVAADKDEALEIGITDTLITNLSRLKGLEVRPTSAVRAYAGLDQDALAAGRQQRVDAVLDGSIQRSGDRIRVTARLVSVATGEQIWAGKFDEHYGNIFAVQDSISRQLAESVMKLTGKEKELISKHYSENVEAYNLYLKGRYFWNKRSDDSLLKAIEYFNQAIKKDPGYALAYAGLADVYVVLPGHGGAVTKDTHPKAKANALKALEIDSQLPEPHVTLATIAADYWQWDEAERQFKSALELNPNYATAHQWYGEYLLHVGRVDEASSAFKRALELDPTSPVINVLVGEGLYFSRRYDAALTQLQKTLELEPNFPPAYHSLGMVYREKGAHEESKAAFKKAYELSGGASIYLAFLGTAHARAGNVSEARSILETLKKMVAEKRAHSGDLVIMYSGMKDTVRAFEWMEQAYEERSPVLLYLADPLYDELRPAGVFSDFERRVRGKQ